MPPLRPSTRQHLRKPIGRRPAPLMQAACALLLAALPAACGRGDGNAADEPIVRDSAGVRIVDHAPADSASLTWLGLRPDPLVLGAAADGAGLEFFQVRDAERFADGGIVVANGGSAELLYFGPDGDHVATAGRRGGGPGEFQQIATLVLLPGDSVLAYDGVANRASVFDRSGNFAREFVASADPRVTLLGRFAEGSLVGTAATQLRGEALQNGLQTADIVHVRYRQPAHGEDAGGGAGGGRLDTLAIGPGSERVLNMTQERGQIRSIEVMTPPFGRTTVTAIAGSVLYIGTQRDPEIRAIDPGGAVVRLIRTGTPERAVTPELKEVWTERRVEALPPERQAAARQTYAGLEFPAVVPFYGSILAAGDGTLWIQDFTGTDDPNDWTLHAPDGRRRARIRLPERFRPLGVGDDWVLGIERDDLDVEQVRLYRFGPAES